MNATSLDQTSLDRLSESQLVAQIDHYVKELNDPNCSPHLVGGVCLKAMVYLDERAGRAARRTNEKMEQISGRMLSLTKYIFLLTIVTAILAAFGVYFSCHR